MQKKINLLATLLVIAIVLGGLSTCSDASFREGFRVGAEEETVKFEPGFGSDEDAGENPEEAYIARLRLLPRRDYRAFPFSFRNTLTGAEVPMAPEAVKLAIPKEDPDDFVWIPTVIGLLGIGAAIAFILLLILFVTSIKSGGIFLKGNEKTLRWMGGILLGWYALGWVETLSTFFRARELVKLEDYLIVFDAPNVYPLVLGFALLFFAQIFAKGRMMEEDQQFMV